MPTTTYLPTVLVVDDDSSITTFLRAHFHQDTSVGVLVANRLADAKALVDAQDIPITAIVADLFFDIGTDDPQHDLLDGIDILSYAKEHRPDVAQYVFSVWTERDRERQEAQRRDLPIRKWIHKLFPEERHRAPWAEIQRDLFAFQMSRDPDLPGRLASLGVTPPDSLEVVSEYARTVTGPVRTYLQTLPSSEYRLRRPVEVMCFRTETTHLARAPLIGLLIDGSGSDVEEALVNLAELLIEQKEIFDAEDPALLPLHCRIIKERLDAHIESASATPTPCP